jgi:hypothetical protein
VIGPVIAEQTIQEGVELGLIAKPRIIIKQVPLDRSVQNLRKFPDVYEQGVVQNKRETTVRQDNKGGFHQWV